MAATARSSPPKGRIRPVCGLGIDVHEDFYVVVEQVGGSNPKPPQRFGKQAFLHWAARLKEKNAGAQVHAVYEACGFGFSLQRQLAALGIDCHVVCPQKLDERNVLSCLLFSHKAESLPDALASGALRLLI